MNAVIEAEKPVLEEQNVDVETENIGETQNEQIESASVIERTELADNSTANDTVENVEHTEKSSAAETESVQEVQKENREMVEETQQQEKSKNIEGKNLPKWLRNKNNTSATSKKSEKAIIKPLETEEEIRTFLKSYKANMADLSITKSAYVNYYYPPMRDDIQTIALLKRDISVNFFDIGGILKKYKSSNNNRDYYYLLKHPMVDVKKSQANKIIAVHNYISNVHSGQLTGIQIRLGIEKLYEISTINDNEYYEKLEDYTLEKKLTVTVLKSIVENINQNVGITVEDAHDKALKDIKAKKTTQDKTYSQADVNALNEKIKQLEEKNKQLEQELEEQKLLSQTQEEVPDNTEIQLNTQIVESQTKNSESDKKVYINDSTENKESESTVTAEANAVKKIPTIKKNTNTEE